MNEPASIRKAPSSADRIPIAERWNSEEQLVLWRAAWADVTNRHLETAGHEERIDHRSHADRGLSRAAHYSRGCGCKSIGEKGYRF